MKPRARRSVCWVWLAMLSIAPLLSGCGKNQPSQDPLQDAQTEARREQDCADPQWKAENLGLWYNLCATNSH